VAGFRATTLGTVLDQMDADDVQVLGAGDIEGGPGKLAVADIGIHPLAGSEDGPATEDAVGQGRTTLFAREMVGRAENLADKVGGGSFFVIELLDADDIGLEGLENADAGVFLGLAGIVGEVGRGDGDRQSAAVRRSGGAGADDRKAEGEKNIDTVPHERSKLSENGRGVHPARRNRPGG